MNAFMRVLIDGGSSLYLVTCTVRAHCSVRRRSTRQICLDAKTGPACASPVVFTLLLTGSVSFELHMDIGAEPRVVREVASRIVGVVVDDHVVAIPVPI